MKELISTDKTDLDNNKLLKYKKEIAEINPSKDQKNKNQKNKNQKNIDGIKTSNNHSNETKLSEEDDENKEYIKFLNSKNLLTKDNIDYISDETLFQKYKKIKASLEAKGNHINNLRPEEYEQALLEIKA